MSVFDIFKKKSSDVTLEVQYSTSSITPDVLPNYAKNIPNPNWYKTLEKSSHCPVEHGFKFNITAKTCPGIIGTFNTGIYLLCPFDILFYRNREQDDTLYYVPVEMQDRADIHNDSQMNDAFKGKFLTLKIKPGYSIKCKENIDFMMTYPMLANAGQNSGNVFGPDGVLNFKYQNHANIFLHVRTHIDGNDEKIMIRKGTPLAHLMPLTERKVVLKYTQTSDWEPAPTGYLEGVGSHYITMRNLHRKLNEREK